MTTREDIWDRLDQAHALPYGPARSALVAEAVTWADAIEDEEAAVVTRLELIHAYQWGREHWKGVAPFVWCLARQAERPDLFHHNRLYHLMWNYKWVVTAAAANPRVSLEQVRLLEDGMESFFRSQGASMHTVHGQRYYVAVDLGLPDEARAELAAWRATPRDENSDCVACDPERQVGAARRAEDWELAVATAVPVLREDVGCGEQPAGMQNLVLLPLLASGRPRAAWEAHLRSYRRHRVNPRYTAPMGRHLEYLALSGHLVRGLEILRRHASWTADADEADSLQVLLIGIALVLREAERAGLGQEPLGVDLPSHAVWGPEAGVDAEATVSRARQQILTWVRSLTAAYDARNGNPVLGRDLERALAREPFAVADFTRILELISPSEPLPEAAPVSDLPEAGAGPNAGSGSSASPDANAKADAVPEASGGTDQAPGTAGQAPGGASQAPDPRQEHAEPYPPLSLPVLTPPADGLEAATRIQRLPAAMTLEATFLHQQVRERGLLPVDEEGLTLRQRCDLAMMAGAAAFRLDDPYQAMERRRQALVLAQQEAEQDPGIDSRLHVTCVALSCLRSENAAAERTEITGVDQDEAQRMQYQAWQGRVGRLHHLASRLRADVAELAQGTPEDRRTAMSGLDHLVRCSYLLNDLDLAAEVLQQAEELVRDVEARGEDPDGILRDVLDLDRVAVSAMRGEPYQACVLADSLLRRHDPCPAWLALAARDSLGWTCGMYGMQEEAARQLQESANISLALDVRDWATETMANLANALGATGRFLEAAEVLETAIGLLRGPGLQRRRMRLLWVLTHVLDDLNEYARLQETSQELAELELATGNDKGALAAFERAARASYELKKAHTAAALYQRCADLEDLDSPGGALRRSRLLRRAAFALTRQPTTAMTRAQLPRARDLWQLGADLLDQAWERPCEESVQERADAYEQLGEILWSGTELQEAGGHFATAARLYAEVGRSEDQARVTAHVARIHAILIQEDPATHVPLARQGVAQVRALLAHPRWEGNPALEDVGKVEQYLDSLEPAGARSAG